METFAAIRTKDTIMILKLVNLEAKGRTMIMNKMKMAYKVAEMMKK